jgi:Ni/Fe-hydrogenase subunit HybB-like protein
VSERAQRLGGPIFTRPVRVLIALFAVGAILILWRLAAGLGATTALSDGYPWGLWIAFDVVTGTALACGGYFIAILVYILNKGRYHPMIRPAILTSALGYTMAGVSVFLDIGRWWLAWKLPLFFWSWNLRSVLLEVALCIMAYTFVVWLELTPAFLERFREGPDGRLKRFSQKAYPIVDKSLIWIIALGLLLPTMHQSSLGSLMLLTGPKLHPLWQTPFLPLLFLLSCIAMGYAAVVFESMLANLLFRRKPETDMLAALSRAMLPVLAGFFILRIGDLATSGRLSLAFVPDRYALAFWLETVLIAMPLVLLASAAQRRDPGNLFRAAMIMMLAGGLYRFNTFLVAYRPGEDVHYFPSAPELLITGGLIALEIIGYLVIVKTFPIFSGMPRRAAQG